MRQSTPRTNVLYLLYRRDLFTPESSRKRLNPGEPNNKCCKSSEGQPLSEAQAKRALTLCRTLYSATRWVWSSHGKEKPMATVLVGLDFRVILIITKIIHKRSSGSGLAGQLAQAPESWRTPKALPSRLFGRTERFSGWHAAPSLSKEKVLASEEKPTARRRRRAI